MGSVTEKPAQASAVPGRAWTWMMEQRPQGHPDDLQEGTLGAW